MTSSDNAGWRNPNARKQGQKLSLQLVSRHVPSGISHGNAGIVSDPSQFVAVGGKGNSVDPTTSLKFDGKNAGVTF